MQGHNCLTMTVNEQWCRQELTVALGKSTYMQTDAFLTFCKEKPSSFIRALLHKLQFVMSALKVHCVSGQRWHSVLLCYLLDGNCCKFVDIRLTRRIQEFVWVRPWPKKISLTVERDPDSRFASLLAMGWKTKGLGIWAFVSVLCAYLSSNIASRLDAHLSVK